MSVGSGAAGSACHCGYEQGFLEGLQLSMADVYRACWGN